MSATRTGILPGAPLTAASTEYQGQGIEPWSLELVNVNVGIPDPTYTRDWGSGSYPYHQTLGPVWVTDFPQGAPEWEWESPTHPRHEGVGVTASVWRATVHSPSVGEASAVTDIDGTKGEPVSVRVLTPDDTTDALYASGRWSGTERDEDARWQVDGLRAYLARYSYCAPFGHSMGDATLSAATSPRNARKPVIDEYDEDGTAEVSVALDVPAVAGRITTTIATFAVIAWTYDGRVLEEWGRV